MLELLTQKKNQLERYGPLPSALISNLNQWFEVELTYTSNALEGNTLTRQETALVIEKGLTIGGKKLGEHLEAKNHLPNPQKVPYLMEHFFEKLNHAKDDPVTKAAMAHDDLVTIHPFVDGSGRTARLLMNLILMQADYPPAIIDPVDRCNSLRTSSNWAPSGAFSSVDL